MTNATPQDFRDLKGVGCRQHKIKCECFLTFLSNPWHFILFKLCAQSSVKSTREQCLEGPMGFFSGRKKNFFCFPVFHWSAQLFDTFTILFYYNKAAASRRKRRLKTKKWTYFWWFEAKQKLWKKSSVQLIKNLPQNVVSKFIGPIFIHTCLEKLLGLPYLPDFMSP